MLINRKSRKAILLSFIAFLSFLGCNKMENETSSSLMMTNSQSQSTVSSDIETKSGGTTSTTGFPMIDLGILGDAKPECAYGVNNSGKVVGTFPSWGPPLAFLWSRQYGVKYLGTLGGVEHSFSMANDINDRGKIVGTSWEPGTTQLRAFLWSDNGGMVNLGAFGEYGDESFSLGFGINNRGEIVGETDNYAFLWTKERGMVLLGSPMQPWTGGAAWDINDHGWIVGHSQVFCCPDLYHAALWTDVGEVLDLGTLRMNSQALGINNLGVVVGGSSDQEFDFHHIRIGGGYTSINNPGINISCVPFIWTKKDGMFPLPMLDGDTGCAHAINDRGQVVGWSYTLANEVHAFVWNSKNGIKDLGTIPGATVQESVAYNINNLGQVVGYAIAEDGTRHAVIWTVK
jgi:probable HAF family extracellular repeat protein